MRGGAHRTCSYRQGYLHLDQLFQRRLCGGKQAHTVREEIGRYLAAPPHQFLNRRANLKGILVELDCDPVTHAEDVSVIFAAITNSVLREQFCVDLVPPWLGVGEHAIEIES